MDKRSTAQVDLAVACGAEAGHFSVFFRGRFRSCVFHPDTLCQGYPNRPAHLFIRCFSRLPASLTADIDGCQDLVTALQQAVRKKIENDRLHAWLLGPLTRTLVRLAARMIAPRRSTACIDVFAMLVRLRGQLEKISDQLPMLLKLSTIVPVLTNRLVIGSCDYARIPSSATFPHRECGNDTLIKEITHTNLSRSLITSLSVASTKSSTALGDLMGHLPKVISDEKAKAIFSQDCKRSKPDNRPPQRISLMHRRMRRSAGRQTFARVRQLLWYQYCANGN